MKSSPIVFFGSGPVAGKSLEFLANHFNIHTVITKPRPPHHKGDVPVIRIAESKKIPIITVKNRQDLDLLIKQKLIPNELGILIDFGIIISQEVISYFHKGIVNSHFSLLPKWRGADPISFAILNGDKKTGVSLMLIDEGMDTGKLLTQRTFHIPPNLTTPELTESLIELSNELLLQAIPKYLMNLITPKRQPHPDRATYSRKLSKNDSIIDWNKSANALHNEIRAYSGWPGSKTTIFNKDVILIKTNIIQKVSDQPGTIEVDKKQGQLMVHTGHNILDILYLKPVGKRTMTAKEFIAGYYTKKMTS